MLDIERQPRKAKSIPLISLIDVVFQLLIISCSLPASRVRNRWSLHCLRRLRLNLWAEASKAPDMKTLHIYISDTGETFLERDSLGEKDMSDKLSEIFSGKTRPRRACAQRRQSYGRRTGEGARPYLQAPVAANIAVADWVIPSKPVAAGEGRHNG